MSIENGERLIRLLAQDASLREKVRAGGSERFEQISAEAGASCRAFDVVVALLRDMARDSESGGSSRPWPDLG